MKTILAVVNVNALPSKKPGIDGSKAGPQSRQRCAQSCEEDSIFQMASSGEGKPDFDDYDKHSRYGRPQSYDQKRSRPDCDRLQDDCLQSRCPQQCGDPVTN
jgi:hypothetical protein